MWSHIGDMTPSWETSQPGFPSGYFLRPIIAGLVAASLNHPMHRPWTCDGGKLIKTSPLPVRTHTHIHTKSLGLLCWVMQTQQLLIQEKAPALPLKAFIYYMCMYIKIYVWVCAFFCVVNHQPVTWEMSTKLQELWLPEKKPRRITQIFFWYKISSHAY